MTGQDLGTLVNDKTINLSTVTTIHVSAARANLARRDATDVAEMLGIDDQGVADGIARGIWTRVPA